MFDYTIKTKWLDALRGGEYKQTHSVLQDEGGHCCLGVLCAIQGAGRTETWNKMTSNVPAAYSAGLSNNLQGKLASLNDNGMDFEGIAKVIEAFA